MYISVVVSGRVLGVSGPELEHTWFQQEVTCIYLRPMQLLEPEVHFIVLTGIPTIVHETDSLLSAQV